MRKKDFYQEKRVAKEGINYRCNGWNNVKFPRFVDSLCPRVCIKWERKVEKKILTQTSRHGHY